MPFQQTVTLNLPVLNPLGINPGTLAMAMIGLGYSVQFVGSGGTPPYIFSATGLPAGLSMSTDGLLSGTPTGPANTYPITVTMQDSSV